MRAQGRGPAEEGRRHCFVVFPLNPFLPRNLNLKREVETSSESTHSHLARGAGLLSRLRRSVWVSLGNAMKAKKSKASVPVSGRTTTGQWSGGLEARGRDTAGVPIPY